MDAIFNPEINADYNTDEEYLYIKPYLFIKGFATCGNYKYTLKALPLARKIHNGQYRKGFVEIDGKQCRLPYFLHCLKVCSTLISLNLPLLPEELDILYACSILHDTYEERPDLFTDGGREYIQIYGFPKEVMDIILLLSKKTGASLDDLKIYFNKIKMDKTASLIKLADRSHNVEDLYTMKIEKLHKYVDETRDFIYPLATYVKQNYTELSNGATILKAKIVSLTECTETIVEMYDEKIETIKQEYELKIAALQKNTI